jgi:hypothetical protein
MPLPLLFIAVAATTGLVGVGKSVKAAVDTHNANKINEEANDIVESAKKSTDRARKLCAEDLNKLGKKKINILDSSINHFIHSFGKLKNVNFRESKGLNEIGKLYIDSADFKELKELGNFATSILGGVASGALGGAITAFGAYSAAGSLATASTGTAIASLSGAAATNATLAFFGGGSLAAGGLGIAGGTMVLGGLVAGPALAIMGFVVGAKASSAKDEAYSNLAKAKKTSAELMVAVDLCNAISSKCNMFINLLNKLDTYFKPLINKIDEAISQHGTDYNKFNQEQKQATAAAASIAKSIKMVLDTPILDSNGNITKESGRILSQIKPESLSKGDDTCLSIDNNNIEKKELSINQIIFVCESYVHKRSKYPGGEKEECANINWDKLMSLIKDSYEIDCNPEEYAIFINNFGATTSIWLNDLQNELKHFIYTYQISYIVSLYLKSQNDILKDSDIDWTSLLQTLKNVYGITVKKWQLFMPNKNTIETVIKNVCNVISAKSNDSEYNYFTASEFFQKLA